MIRVLPLGLPHYGPDGAFTSMRSPKALDEPDIVYHQYLFARGRGMADVWRRSSFSGGDGGTNCVEVALPAGVRLTGTPGSRPGLS